MSWKDALKEASFKGVPFKTDTATVEFGWTVAERETATSELKWKEGKAPLNDPASQTSDPHIDKGKKGAKVFTVDAHFTGDDYIANRDAFIAAIEEGGPGILQLPLMKAVSAYASRGASQYSNVAGGYESVSIKFIETTEKPKPNASVNQARAAAATADNGSAKLLSGFVGDGETDDEETLEEASVRLSTVLPEKSKFSAFAEGAAELADTLSVKLLESSAFGDAGPEFSNFVSKAMALSEDARTIIQTPQRFAEEILDVISNLTYAFTNPIDALNAQLFIFETFRDSLDFGLNGSESKRLQVQNNEMISMLVESACVMQAGLSAINSEYETLNDALNARSKFETAVRTQRLRLGNAEGYGSIYDSLGSLLGSVTQYINEAANLPSTITVDFQDRNPSLALAEDYYGDADRADELVRRNNVKNPLFCNVEMEILSR